MKIKTLMLGCTTLLAACAGQAQQPDYRVNINFGDRAPEGAAACLLDYDTGEAIDSCRVSNGMASFAGHIDAARFVRLTLGGERVTSFVLEPAEITVGRDGVTGGKLNETLSKLSEQLDSIEKSFAALPADATDAQRQAVIDRYRETLYSAMRANNGNPVAYYIFLQSAYEMSPEELDEFLAEYPHMREYKRVRDIIDAQARRHATSPGHKYTDFEVTYDGKTERFSDYVKPGRYTLVDFWASWCGPCIRQTAVIKRLYEQYKDKGLDVVGVAVWDDPANTLEAIKEHDLAWPCMLNAQSVPTELYGIQGIPCIMLIGPDGTILSRDKQDEELIREVSAAIDGRE